MIKYKSYEIEVSFEKELDKKYKRVIGKGEFYCILEVLKKNKLQSYILLAGKSTPETYSFILDGNKIYVLVSTFLYCLELPTLKAIWFTKINDNYTFDLFQFNKGKNLLILGETSLTMLDLKGHKVWEFKKRQLFFDLRIEDTYLVLYRLGGGSYKINYKGELIK